MRTQRYIFNYKVKIKKQLFRFSRAAKPRICKRRRFRRGGTLQKRTKRVRKRSIGPPPEGAAREDGRPCVRGKRPARPETAAAPCLPRRNRGSTPTLVAPNGPHRPDAGPAGREAPRRNRGSVRGMRPAPFGNGSGSMPASPEQRVHAGPRRAQRSAPARTGPTPALLPDDPAPPVRGTTPDARHSNTLPAPTTHRPEPSVRHPTAAPPGDAAHPLPRPAPDTPPQPVPGKLAAPHHREAIRAGRTGTHPSTCPAPARTYPPPPGMRRGPIFARYSPNVLPSDK